ncbi:Hydrogenase expression/formation protein HoxO, partial [Bienertia sinuspersici]
MATKLGNLSPTSCLSFTSINNTKKLVTTTKTPSRTRTLNYPHEIPQFHTTPFIPVVRASSGPNSPESSSPTKPHNSVPPPTLQRYFTRHHQTQPHSSSVDDFDSGSYSCFAFIQRKSQRLICPVITAWNH